MSQTPAPGPQISADGRFYWDGARWAPVPGAPANPTPTRLPGALLLSGATLVVVATFLPWLDATAPFVGTISKNLISSGDGQFLAGAAVAAGLLGLTMLVRGPNVAMAVLAILLAALASWIIVVDYQDLSGRVANVTTGEFKIIADVGPGP